MARRGTVPGAGRGGGAAGMRAGRRQQVLARALPESGALKRCKKGCAGSGVAREGGGHGGAGLGRAAGWVVR